MSDFLQTLIARNSSNMPPSTLQPRLPALFESLDAAGNPSLPMETVVEGVDRPQTVSARDSQPQPFVAQPETAPDPQPDRHLQSSIPFKLGSIPSNLADEIEAVDQSPTKTIFPPEAELPGRSIPATVHTDQASTLPESIRPPKTELPGRSIPATVHTDQASTLSASPRLERIPGPPENSRPVLTYPRDTIGQVEVVHTEPLQESRSDIFVRPAALPVQPVSKQMSVRQAQADHMESTEQETTIRVHIGRIEVRAVTPPAPGQPVQRTPKPKNTLSLDDYLKQRSEGKR